MFPVLLPLLLGACRIQAKAVFAHFLVSNAANFSVSDWQGDILQAQAASVQAFALNIAYNQNNDPQIANAFTAANDLGFQLFFSFDYSGNGPWPEAEVISLIQQYSSNGAYYQYNGKPFVSTFEGPDQANDWIKIKATTGCFFLPDWSSQGAKVALELAGGVADGLFSWAAWPWGNENMNTYVDASYLQYLDGKPYMMPVAPWFYTNLPGYNKNWLWRGDDLWFDRWQEVLYVQPEFVEIISWNDYGECHYIGPLHDDAFELFTIGKAAYNYAENMPHDGWRLFLPFSINMYLNNITTITQEGLVFWYRLQPASACGTGQTTGNTASQLQIEFQPYDVVQDEVFYTALLTSPADVSVGFEGTVQTGAWTTTPDGGIGLYHGSIPFSSNLGVVTVSVSRSGAVIMGNSGPAISTECTDSLENWNAWVGQATGDTVSATPTSLSAQVCINGTGAYNFAGLCAFGCSLGYCPIGACLCTEMGVQRPKPSPQNINGYPIAGEDASYSGLCAFDCNLGYCPDTACGTVSVPLTTPTVSDFLPPACIAGTGEGNWEGLCSFGCNYGMCPIQRCTCTAQGALVESPPVDGNITGSPLDGENDWGLCEFACPRGYCPDGACSSTTSPTTSSIPGITPSPTTTPAPSFVTCTFQNEDPDQGIDTTYCVCSGSTFPAKPDTLVTPPNSCAYTTLPTSTIQITTNEIVTTLTAECEVCTLYGDTGYQCSSLEGCALPTPTTTGTTTTTAASGIPTPPGFSILVFSDYNCKDYINGYSWAWNGNEHCYDAGTNINSYIITTESDNCLSLTDAIYQDWYISTTCTQADNIGGGCGADNTAGTCLQNYFSGNAQYVISALSFGDNEN